MSRERIRGLGIRDRRPERRLPLETFLSHPYYNYQSSSPLAERAAVVKVYGAPHVIYGDIVQATGPARGMIPVRRPGSGLWWSETSPGLARRG
ncbi:hypothetical protein RRG08_036741 [Elysia crispata]|uniref:Uncharacterized protein n=1 Tax=Elysia crispata TaxID=231223 RepID=A0AAE0ZGQ1_9GAST|nr:hypothetical protein RRG08_036741 [Elysia crispata]